MTTFEKTYQFDQPLEIVYDHWIAESTVVPPAERMAIDARPGGYYRLHMAGGITMNGTFEAVEPNEFLRYRWQWQGDEEESVVAVRFTATKGGCQVNIVHSGFLTEQSYDNHANGWDSYVLGFTALLNER